MLMLLHSVVRELLEYMGTTRQVRQDDVDPTQLVILLKQKDAEFQRYMKIGHFQMFFSGAYASIIILKLIMFYHNNCPDLCLVY